MLWKKESPLVPHDTRQVGVGFLGSGWLGLFILWPSGMPGWRASWGVECWEFKGFRGLGMKIPRSLHIVCPELTLALASA